MNRRLFCRAAALCTAALLAGACAASGPERPTFRERMRELLDRSHGYMDRGLQHDFLVRVKPWERDLLARQDMAPSPDALRSLRRSHIFFSKEASTIGGSAGGGGCGCN